MAWLVVAAVIVLPFLVHVKRHGELADLYSGEAFAAFYCAGEAIDANRDPYRVEPLRGCEARAHVIPRGVVEPAPLPPVTLAFFALLAKLPYLVASLLWGFILVGCVFATALLLEALAPRVPSIAIWTALLPGIAYDNGRYGEVPALVIAGLVWAGYGLRKSHTVAVVCGVTVAALFEPHVGGAAWLGVLFFVPHARFALLILGAAALLGSFVTVGWNAAISYATAVLPLHAVSELHANDQYSLTSILFQLGVASHPALVAGSLSYVLALALGLAAGAIVARRLDAPEFVVFFPAAAVLFGGTFIHDVQMGLAIPLAVAAANASTLRYRGAAYFGLLAGAVPTPIYTTPLLAFGSAAGFAAAWSARARATAAGRLLFGALGFGAYLAVFYALRKVGAASTAVQDHIFATSFPQAPANDFAEGSWTAYVTAIAHPPTPGEQLARALQYLALLSIFLTAWFARRATGVSRPNADGNSPV